MKLNPKNVEPSQSDRIAILSARLQHRAHRPARGHLCIERAREPTFGRA